MKNNLTGVIIGVLILVIVIIGVIHYQEVNNVPPHSGGVYVGISDATTDISGVSDIDMSVKKVEVHSALAGWMTIGSDTKTYQLLALHSSGETKFYAKGNITAGSYDKIRVTLGDTTVHTTSNGDVQATLPSSQVVFNTAVAVNEGQNSNIKLDFMADKSLHAASGGKYVFTPVVNSEARSNANVNIDTNDKMAVTGGSVDSQATVGVDLDGSSKSNFVLPIGSPVQIGASNGTSLTFMLGGKTYTSDTSKVQEDQADVSANAKGTLKATNPGGLNVNLNTNGSTNSSTNNGSTGSGYNTSGNLNLNTNLNLGH
jgi:Domain of unknown function (DUF4382)